MESCSIIVDWVNCANGYCTWGDIETRVMKEGLVTKEDQVESLNVNNCL